ncbi:WecB/TagA/CpsF family glycosyltransferase [Caulobacter sp. DWR2-3-1b2]|uniref:WecB/TagA/CpsF family glycosyltransferase n=1 Tax=unclassified Caulobacter TaxID=2648921 RepID=UPI003CF31C7A
MNGRRRLLVGGVPTTRITRAELAGMMVEDCLQARAGVLTQPLIIISSNGAVIADFHANRAFREMVLEADVIDADGMPLVMATRLLCREPLSERVATTDFILDASAAAAREGLRFFFLGAKPGVAQTAADHLLDQYPGLQIVGIRHGYFDREDEAAICEEILAARADVVWIGLGSPIQESFALRNRARLSGVAWLRTCGGMFDHYSGKFHRAPLWMQRNGLEWLYRTFNEPLRLGRRYLGTNLPALFYLATQTSDAPRPKRASRADADVRGRR